MLANLDVDWWHALSHINLASIIDKHNGGQGDSACRYPLFDVFNPTARLSPLNEKKITIH